MTLTNIELEALAMEFNVPNFQCIMNDELPKKQIRDGNYVINLDDADTQGSHWVAFIVKNGQRVYGDSFGVVPSLQVSAFLKKEFLYNTRIIQDLKSTDCGLFALGLIIFCHQHQGDLYVAAEKYYNLFNPTNLKRNDKIIKNLFKMK